MSANPGIPPPEKGPTWGCLLKALPGDCIGRMRWWLSDRLDRPLTMLPLAEIPTPEELLAFGQACMRLDAGEPIQYICGRAPFLDMTLSVSPSVLIPRPETEQLISLILQREAPPARILDVGTGSGCIALALKRAWPKAAVTAVDVSEQALEVARGNAEALRAEVRFLRSDLLQALDGELFDPIVANLPYVGEAERAELPREVRDFEPPLALFAGSDGTDLVLKLMGQARRALNPGGSAYLETGESQTDIYRKAAPRLGWDLQSHADLAGRERFHRLTPREEDPF